MTARAAQSLGTTVAASTAQCPLSILAHPRHSESTLCHLPAATLVTELPLLTSSPPGMHRPPTKLGPSQELSKPFPGQEHWVSLAGTPWAAPGDASALELLPSPVPSPGGSASLPQAVIRLNFPVNSPAVIHSCSFISPSDLDNKNHLPTPLTMFGGDEVPAPRGPPLTGERWRPAREGSRGRKTSGVFIRAPGRLHASGTAPPRAAPKTFHLPRLRLLLWCCRGSGVLGSPPSARAAPGPAKHRGRCWAEQVTSPPLWPGTPITRRHLGHIPGSPHLGGSARGYGAAVPPPCAHPG